MMERIENGIGAGIPDVYLLFDFGKTVWVELKTVLEPIRQSTAWDFGMSIEQRNWHFDCHQHGGKSWFLVQTDRRWFAVEGQHSDILFNGDQESVQRVTNMSWNETIVDGGWNRFITRLARC